ncbi:MAG: anion permease, partial [Alphaproteobacteria bacterium]|nr:anion permease [Alphaproteobacteria bacterium]
RMFDFAPVGIACAVAGVAFVAVIGWRLLPRATRERRVSKELFDLGSYLVELQVGEGSRASGMTLGEIEVELEAKDTILVTLLRDGEELPAYARWLKAREGDVLLVETFAANLDAVVKDLELSFSADDPEGEETVDRAANVAAAAEATRAMDGSSKATSGRPAAGDAAGADKKERRTKLERPEDISLIEVVIRPGAVVEGRTAAAMRLHEQYGVWLVGISREGRKVTRRVRQMSLRAGDVLLLLGLPERVQLATERMGALPLAQRGLQVRNGKQAAIAATIFAAAIGLASVGLLYLPVALAGVTILYVLLRIVPARQLYDAIEWPVVVLIGSLIPIGIALEKSGGTELLANWIVNITHGAPAWVVLTLLMIVTMTLSDVLNNTATALIAAPVAIGVANSLNVNPDPFLMAVAVAASCAFLTPIGHKNNTLIMGPGGYSFGDYWRMGLPLEILIVAVAVPMILLVWPL